MMIFCISSKKMTYLCTRFDAQMAESVDALVSNIGRYLYQAFR